MIKNHSLLFTVLNKRFHEFSWKLSFDSFRFILQSEKLIDLSEGNKVIRFFSITMRSQLEFDIPISFSFIIKYSIGLI